MFSNPEGNAVLDSTGGTQIECSKQHPFSSQNLLHVLEGINIFMLFKYKLQALGDKRKIIANQMSSPLRSTYFSPVHIPRAE